MMNTLGVVIELRNAKAQRMYGVSKQKAKYIFHGQDLADPILKWLSKDKPERRDHVLRLIALDALPRMLPGEDRRIEIMQLVKSMNVHLVYTAAPTEANEWTVNLVPSGRKGIPPDERLAFANCLQLKKEGLLSRIRRCSRCRRWYFAKFEWAAFCSDKCRIEMMKENPVRKAARAAYAREHREQLLAMKGE